jgi:predicted esterase
VIDRVEVIGEPEESYALYLPSDYRPDRAWSLLLAFHPSARGAAFVERYRQAAERFGYVVAGSNTSRNGSWDVITRAVRAMSRDAGRRFSIDARRVYLTGHSGGARVAMEVALGPNDIAGVIASSAGFPDAKPRRSVRFPVFATAGIDDFNYLEMRRLDAALTSPHRLAIFDGGHTLPPASVAQDALAWLELEAMKSGRRERDPSLVDEVLEARRAGADRAPPPERLRLLREIVADFDGLRDVAALKAAADALAGDPAVIRAAKEDRAALDAEARMLDDALAEERRLRDPGRRADALYSLRLLFESWARAAASAEPSPQRSRARRLLAAVAAGAAERVSDDEYRDLVRRYRPR